jgi:hypothetical protein
VDDELSYKERLKEFFINPDELKLSLDNTAYMADVNNLTDEGFKLFGYESKKDFLFNIATCHEYSTEIIRSSFSSADFSWVF